MRRVPRERRLHEAYLSQYDELESEVLRAIAEDAGYPFPARTAAAETLSRRGESGVALPPWDPQTGRAPTAIRVAVGVVLAAAVAAIGSALAEPEAPTERTACLELERAVGQTAAAQVMGLQVRACRACLGDACGPLPPGVVGRVAATVCGLPSERAPAGWRAALGSGSACQPGQPGCDAAVESERRCRELPLGEVQQVEGRPWVFVLRAPG